MSYSSNKYHIRMLSNGIKLDNTGDFSLSQTLDCGQAFRWKQEADGSFSGVVKNKVCHISHLDNGVFLRSVSAADYDAVWHDYFDFGRDYEALGAQLSADPILAKAIAYAPGIRLLRQDSWEALCSFIISQNNNIPRIKGIIERLCQTFGESLGEGLYAFPAPSALAALQPQDLGALGAGYRARYLIDAARQVMAGTVDLDALRVVPLDAAREQLMQITGVGRKVADCVLLYGCARFECVPMDVWMKRVMERLLPDGFPDCAKGVEGIAQQYLFHYIRTCSEI